MRQIKKQIFFQIAFFLNIIPMMASGPMHENASKIVRCKVGNQEINIQGNGVSIVNGDTSPSTLDQTDFGVTDSRTPIAIPFIVYSLGSTTLSLATDVAISGPDASCFTATLLPLTLASGNAASFVITFTPNGTRGAKNATVTITSNDSDEATYNFDLRANVVSNSRFRNRNHYRNVADDNDDNENDSIIDTQAVFTKIRLGFNSVENYHRQLLMGFMNKNATSGIDPGYDAALFDDYPSDMYFLNGDAQLVISGEGYFNPENVYPLGVKTALDGNVQFVLDELINFESSQEVFIYDNETGIYHDIKLSIFEVNLTAGIYHDRFSLRFANTALSTTDVVSNNSISLEFITNNNSISVENKITTINMEKVTIFNTLGHRIQTWNVNNFGQVFQIAVNDVSSGTYILQLQTSTGLIRKKIIIR